MSQRDEPARPGPPTGHDRAWIAAHLPHQGSMCLIDEVLDWDDQSARCRTCTHRSGTHPLRAHGRLGAACGLEYAAQAMALHAALVVRPAAPARPAVGMLASARAVRLLVERLDDLDEQLLIGVRRVHADGLAALYEFDLHAGGRLLLEGRLGLLLPSGPAARP